MLATKALAALMAPLSLVLICIVLGLVLRGLGRRRGGNGSLLLGLVLFLLFSSEPVARALLLPLETRYSPITNTEALEGVRYVLVLGSSASNISEHPPTTRLSGVAGLRLVEGIRLHRALPGSTLVLSGGSVFGDAPSATVMSRAAVALGAEVSQLRIHPNPRNTFEEAELMFEAIGSEPYLLVTSASHMPRAMALARKAGTHPIAAPTVLRTATSTSPKSLAFYLPSASALEMTERAFHEYMGLAWGRLRGQL
ncbi:MAG: ElyC/SanA/YdcF family protein [Oleiphilaceae bacterium]|nr:ElyC/SanA/YdcF family protein [Oleiphilaceae bacterium]